MMGYGESNPSRDLFMKFLPSLLAVAVIWTGWNLPAVRVFGSDVYHGTVVDEETGEPLEGASVTVIWYRTPIIQLEGSLYFQNAQETLTDAKGNFSLEVAPGIDWSPFTTLVKEHAVVIYKPGYVPFAPGHIPKEFREYTDLVAAFKKGVTIKLARLKTKEELIRYTTLIIVRVPPEKIPNLTRNINIQRKMAGLRS
jgi:hypothetical protein